ncbi:MAG: trypsin-like peptidase domain-containing protein [Chloroflexi bacterium]|nr:trypsin-like peptidase domain-containing protein [Chloroflexota bacterium]
MKTFRPFLLIMAFILIVGIACNLFAGPTPAANNNSGNDSPTLEPAATTEPTSNNNNNNQGSSANGINSISDAQNAVIQIESQGTFIDPQVGLVTNGAGRGSGFIIDSSGIAVTNNHVVTGSALLKVWVGGVQHNARILGVSECSDLAVIKVEGGPFPFLNWYEDQIKTGLEVYAAGFPLGEPQFSLTKGIISKEKADGQTSWASLDYVLGHDATINPGNSGGPLIATDGRVVGINYSSLASANQYFAIDEKTAKPMIDELTKGKDIDSIGINGTAIKSDDGSFSGIWVSSVKSGSPADKAGIKAGDIMYQMESLVLATDGTMKDYCSILRTHKPEDTLSLTVIRYATGELLEGQLNGRELAVTGNFDVSGGGSGSGSGNGSGSGSGTQGQDFYTETFDGDIGNYSYFEWHEKYASAAADDSLSPTTKDGFLVFDIPSAQKYVYVNYEAFKYTNVRLDLRADNRGKNSNSVSLICRYSDEGWYEANVQNDGLYSILAYVVSDGRYYNIFNGGSNLIKQGKNTNEYSFICNGNDLTLGVNSTKVKTVTDKKYVLQEGLVGFGVSSFDSLPVLVNVDAFQISQP